MAHAMSQHAAIALRLMDFWIPTDDAIHLEAIEEARAELRTEIRRTPEQRVYRDAPLAELLAHAQTLVAQKRQQRSRQLDCVTLEGSLFSAQATMVAMCLERADTPITLQTARAVAEWLGFVEPVSAEPG